MDEQVSVDLILQKYELSEKSFRESIDLVRKWMETQPHFPEILDDKSVENFFILNKCSVERAKMSIDMYYTLRTKIPDLYENSNPKLKNMQEILDILYWVPLPKRSKDLCTVLVFKIRNKELAHKLDPYDVTKNAMNIQELRLKGHVMVGDVVIYDMEGISLGYLLKLTPALISKIYTIYDKVYSIPLKGLYLVNSPPFVNILQAVLKNVLKPKIYERVHVCPDTSILGEHFSKCILPKDYGGEEESLEELQKNLKLKLKQHQGRFDQLDQMRVKEELRPERLKNDDILGFHGNFRKLDVD